MEKPTKIQLREYTQKIESLLDYLNVKLVVYLYDTPIEVTCTFNGTIQQKYNIWIKEIRVSNNEVTNLNVDLYHRMGNPGDIINDKSIWQDAYDIQNCIYRHLKKKVGNPREGDVYWKLWDKIK